MSTEKAQLIDRIRQHLTNWMAKIQLHNGMGLTDINTDSKNICCGLLNIVLDMQFQNMNLLTKNYPAIDLADNAQGICVRVTSTAASSKISSTLNRFFSYRMDSDYHRLIILILGEKKKYRKAFPQKEGFSFDPQQDIWDFPKLLSLIAELDISKLRQVDAYLLEQLGDPGDNVSPSQNRSALLDRIQRILREYADTIKANITSRRTDILVDSEIIFRDLLNMVYDFKLVLANQHTKNYSAVDLVDQDNSIAVQITSSNTQSKVQHTSDQFLEHGFNQSYKTLFILILVYAPPFRNADLLFTQLREKGVDLQIRTLWDLTREIGALPLELISEIAEFLDQNIGTNTLQKQSDDTSIPMPSTKIDDLTDVLRQTFRLTTLLPATGLERSVLEHGLTLEQKHALVDLIHHGFLLKEGSMIRIHPAFQDNSDYSPSQDECAFLLEQLWNFEDSYRWDRFNLRSKTQVTNSLAQLFSKASGLFPTSPIYAQRSAELWHNTQHYTDALNLGQQALSGFRSIKNESWDVARALHFIGECHIELKQPKLALVDWEQTLELCQNPLRASASDLATAYQNVGIALLELKEYHAAKAYLLRSLKIMEALRRESKDFLTLPWMEIIYNSLSTVCTALSNVQHAMLCKQNVILPPTEQKDLWEILVQLPPMPSTLTGGAFVGRDMEMHEIEERLLHDKVVYLSGLGGMGKTELALCFGRMYNRGMVYFVPFQESFFNTIANGIGTHIDRFTVRSQEEAYQLAMDRLAQCPDTDILIIDNVDADEGSLSDLMKDSTYKELRSMNLRLILTTRFDVDRAVCIRPMPKSSLYQIFEKHGVFLEKAQMDELIDAVHGHTLTIDLMARTLNGKGWRKVTAEMMLDAIRNNTPPSEQYRKIATDYNQSPDQAQIYQHLRVIFDAAHVPEDCKAVLRYATLLPADGMNGEYFHEALSEAKQDAFETLIDHGWLTAENGLLTIHPVIRLVCREELKPSDENCREFLDALWGQLGRDEYDRVKFAQLAELFENAADTLEDTEAEWLNNSGWLWLELAQHQKVRELYEKHLPALEKRLPIHPSLATAYNNVGMTYDDLGDHQKALEYLLKALAIREKILSPGHPNLATSYNNVGYTYGYLGDHQKALEYLLKALWICEKALPADHPDLAASYNNAGSTYGALGDHKKALEYQLKALAIREKVLPQDHPDLASSYNNVGTTYYALGDHKKAQEHLLKALEIRETALPANHPDLAASYNNVGSTYSALGDHQKALEYLLKALEIREKTLPADHPDLAASYNNVGSTYGDLGNHQKALEYTIKALTIREKVLPPDHPSLASSFNNIASTYSALGDYSIAMEYYLKALAIQEKILPPEHPDLASAYSNIGVTYDELGNHNKALEYLLKALMIQEKALASGHPNLAVSYSNIAWTYHAMGQYHDAAQYMRRAADITNSSLPENHPNRVNYHNWATQIEKDAKMQEAILSQTKSRDIPLYPNLKK